MLSLRFQYGKWSMVKAMKKSRKMTKVLYKIDEKVYNKQKAFPL